MFNWLKKKLMKVETQPEPISEHDQLISKLEDDICRKIAWDFRNNPDDWKLQDYVDGSYENVYKKGTHAIVRYQGIYGGHSVWLDGIKASEVWRQHISRTFNDQAKKLHVISLVDKLHKLECL